MVTRPGRPRTGLADAGVRLGRVVRAHREALGLSRGELAALAGVSVNTLQVIEQGRIADPGFFTVAAVVSRLGVGLDEVLTAVRCASSREGAVVGRGLVSIGYEGRAPEELLEVLRERGVSTLVDVRLNAVSRRAGFSKRALSQSLQDAGIGYLHLRSLGNPRENRAGFATAAGAARGVFRELLDAPPAREELDQLTDLASREVVAVLCMERQESCCHRQLVIEAVRGRRVDLPTATVQ